MGKYQRFIGIDLGGARGKTTALAVLVRQGAEASVAAVLMRGPEHSANSSQPWTDETLLHFLAEQPHSETAIAINAPLTQPACTRCALTACPGDVDCNDVATRWLREAGQELQAQHVMADPNRIVALHQGAGFHQVAAPPAAATQRLPPYTHRCTEVELHYGRGILPREQIGQSSWAITSRANHLRRRLATMGYALNDSLIEVSPRCTIHALFGAHAAQGYKRDADPWRTRASIIEGMESLCFATTSGMSREDVLRNDNCFDALVSAYTGFLRSRDEWTMPEGEPFDLDGWIWAPPSPL
ncbi:MAG: DUF429 domain-containing protein [Myxococcales bacterium]|nr:DUF429 domain-containing protein [Myxococcales bacterium]